jgi:hypothetical protein
MASDDASVLLPLERVLALIDAMEREQHRKVVELARRLRPGVTPEDLRNPHDFPDLDDPDWHFEDGQLAGIQSVRFALHGLTRDLGSDGPANQERALERDAAEGGEQNP